LKLYVAGLTTSSSTASPIKFFRLFNYDNYIKNPEKNKRPFELSGGLNCILERTGIGQGSLVINLVKVYRPYQVMHFETTFKGVLAPSFEFFNILLAVIFLSPPELK